MKTQYMFIYMCLNFIQLKINFQRLAAAKQKKVTITEVFKNHFLGEK